MRPPAIPLDVTLVLVLAVQGLLTLLAVLVVLRKLRRDRRERASARRRAEFAAAIGDGSRSDLARVARSCVGDREALLDLLYVLQRGETPPPDRSAALLDAARRARLVRHLRRGLAARDATTRGVAALVLGALRAPGMEARVARLTTDPDADVRLAACTALADWATAAAAAALIGALESSKLRPERIVEKLAGDWAAPVVCTALERAINRNGPAAVSLRNRVHLIRALELSAYRPSEPLLLRLLATGDAEEKINAARALGAAGSSAAIPALLDAIAADDWPLRAQATRALGRLAAVEALPQIAERLSDPAWWVRKQAGRALVALGPEGGYELLERALEHQDRYARDRADEELRLVAVAADATHAAGLGAADRPPVAIRAPQGRAA
jgi:HEAT repeat protein